MNTLTSSHRNRKLAALTGALIVSLSAACSKFEAGQPSQSQKTPETSAQYAGTGDSTGGNGVENKVFEAYLVDVTQTPEWQTYIAPIERHWESLNGGKKGSSALNIARRMKWYLVPMSLNEIPVARLGVSASQDLVQQLALQNGLEVWIDLRLYEQASSEARALLLLHEVVMGLYKVQFMRMSERCRALSEDGACSGISDESLRAADEVFQPKPKSQLGPEDYANIRAFTDYLYKNSTSFTKLTVQREWLRNGFDDREIQAAAERVRVPEVRSEQPEWTLERLDSLFARERALGISPRYCGEEVGPAKHDYLLQETCNVGFKVVKNIEAGITGEYPTRPVVTLTRKGVEQAFELQSIEEIKIRPYSFPTTNGESRVIAGVHLYGLIPPDSRVGDRVVDVLVILSGFDGREVVIDEVHFFPNRITSKKLREESWGKRFDYLVERTTDETDASLVIAKKSTISNMNTYRNFRIERIDFGPK